MKYTQRVKSDREKYALQPNFVDQLTLDRFVQADGSRELGIQSLDVHQDPVLERIENQARITQTGVSFVLVLGQSSPRRSKEGFEIEVLHVDEV